MKEGRQWSWFGGAILLVGMSLPGSMTHRSFRKLKDMPETSLAHSVLWELLSYLSARQ